MRRATITLTDEIESALDHWMRQQDAAPSLTAVVQTALQEYLARRGLVSGPRTLRITPAPKGSGVRDVSTNHDKYLAGK